MHIAIVHPGLHRTVRGSEIAFETIAHNLTHYLDVRVTLFGSGLPRSGTPYQFQHVDLVPREKFEKTWPKLPLFRSHFVYEEFTFAVNLWKLYRPEDFDITLACSYPFVNWLLNLKRSNHSPPQVFVTQNGEHFAVSNKSEFRFFKCEGLICTNQEYFENNQHRWNCCLITNGVDPSKFFPGTGDRRQFGLPDDVSIALMVSALDPSKRVIQGIRAAAKIPHLHLVVCGDGPERDAVVAEGKKLLGDRFHIRKLPYDQMPEIYRVADVLMHLSLDEPFGNIYLEALATGLPIVAHDHPTTRWIVENNAVLVDTEQSSQIVQGILSALQAKTEDSVANSTALVMSRFTWQAISHDYYTFLKEVLEKYSKLG